MARMKLYEVKDWLKTFGIAKHYYIGAREQKEDKSIGVYDRSDKSPEFKAAGGRDLTTVHTCKVNILLHWEQNARTTIDAADELVEKIQEVERGDFYIGNHYVQFIDIASGGAVDVLPDENGVFEMVVWLDIYYS